MSKATTKPNIGIFSLTSCEGCGFAVIDLHEKFLELKDKVNIRQFRLFEEDIHSDNEKFDIVFIEGSPLTTKNIELVRDLRTRSKIVIAFGSCAHMGGIYHLKQYHDKEKINNFVYGNTKGIENFDVLPIDKIIKVDYVLPGCPISAPEFLSMVNQLVLGKKPTVYARPVCRECQLNGSECLLQKGEICLGPITLGGCDAVCLKSGQGCWGCRGLVEDAEVANLVKQLKKNHTEKEIIKVFEVFGIKEMMNK